MSCCDDVMYCERAVVGFFFPQTFIVPSSLTGNYCSLQTTEVSRLVLCDYIQKQQHSPKFKKKKIQKALPKDMHPLEHLQGEKHTHAVSTGSEQARPRKLQYKTQSRKVLQQKCAP